MSAAHDYLMRRGWKAVRDIYNTRLIWYRDPEPPNVHYEVNDAEAQQVHRDAALLDLLLPVVEAAVDLAPHIKTLSPRMDGNHVCMTSTSASPSLLNLREAVRALPQSVRDQLSALARARKERA
jgi:hypothetical protein